MHQHAQLPAPVSWAKMGISKAAFLFIFLLSSGKSPLPSACLGETGAKHKQVPRGEGRSLSQCATHFPDIDGFGPCWSERAAAE